MVTRAVYGSWSAADPPLFPARMSVQIPYFRAVEHAEARRERTVTSLASELASLAISAIVGGTALLPSSTDAERLGLFVSAGMLALFTLVWFHVLPADQFGAGRGAMGAAVVQAIATVLLAATGGVHSLYFVYYLLPVLATVFHLRPSGTLAVSAVALVLVLALYVSDPTAADPRTADAAMIQVLGLLAVATVSWLMARAVGASQARIVAERSQLRALLESVAAPILVSTAGGIVEGANSAAKALLGPQVVGRRIGEVVPFVSDEPPAGAERSWTGSLADASGRTSELEVRRTVVQGAAGAHLYVVHDISQQAELNRLREQLLYDVAHELRGPLTALENALELLAGDYASLDAKDHDDIVVRARRSSGRMRVLMEDLLSAGNIQSGRFVVRPAAVELERLVSEAVEETAGAVEERQQRVVVRLPEHSTTVRADPRFARQVLTNLLSNASKYGGRGSEILLRAEAENGTVRVVVEDRGPGIAASQRAGLFERYYRVRPGNEEPGVGLGLAIAKGIIEAHGGRIGVESEVGRGTSVWFTLPRAAPR